MSDIRLTEQDVQLEGRRVICSAYDVVLDNPARRRPGDPRGVRRALVHDFDDGLTLNWNQDYPGGVTIRGVVSLPEGIQDARIASLTLRLRSPRTGAVMRRPGRGLGLGYPLEEEIEYETITEIDVADELDWLRDQILDLSSRVRAIEESIA